MKPGGEGHPEGFRCLGGVIPTWQHSPTILLSSLSRYRFHIWLARSSSLRGKVVGWAASLRPGITPLPRTPLPLTSVSQGPPAQGSAGHLRGYWGSCGPCG